MTESSRGLTIFHIFSFAFFMICTFFINTLFRSIPGLFICTLSILFFLFAICSNTIIEKISAVSHFNFTFAISFLTVCVNITSFAAGLFFGFSGLDDFGLRLFVMVLLGLISFICSSSIIGNQFSTAIAVSTFVATVNLILIVISVTNAIDKTNCTTPAIGTVISCSYTNTSVNGVPQLAVKIEYQTQTGETAVGEVRVLSFSSSYSKGKKVAIYYNPQNTKRISLASDTDNIQQGASIRQYDSSTFTPL